jgi:hypothetical protein
VGLVQAVVKAVKAVKDSCKSRARGLSIPRELVILSPSAVVVSFSGIGSGRKMKNTGNHSSGIGGCLILGTESNYVRDVKESLQFAQANSQDFIAIPLVSHFSHFPVSHSKVPSKNPTGSYNRFTRIGHEIRHGPGELHLDRKCGWEDIRGTVFGKVVGIGSLEMWILPHILSLTPVDRSRQLLHCCAKEIRRSSQTGPPILPWSIHSLMGVQYTYRFTGVLMGLPPWSPSCPFPSPRPIVPKLRKMLKAVV